jgi:hypothetical protein
MELGDKEFEFGGWVQVKFRGETVASGPKIFGSTGTRCRKKRSESGAQLGSDASSQRKCNPY